jgi:hypothetical protein
MRAALTKLRIVNALHARRAPFNSGFAQKARKTPRLSGGSVL